MDGKFVITVVLCLTIGILIGAISMQNYQKSAPQTVFNDAQISQTPTQYPTDIPDVVIISQVSTPVQTREQKIQDLVFSFQQAISERNVQKTMSLFTPPILETEIRSYQSLMGLDAAGPRLFNNVQSVFVIDSWQITETQDMQVGGKLTTRVLVEEQRKNWSPLEGGYTSPTPVVVEYDIVETNGEFKIANYYFFYTDAGGAGGSIKYNGLGF